MKQGKGKQQQQTAAALQAAVDFLEFTLPVEAFHDLIDLLPGGLTPLDRGWRGYTSCALVASGKGRVGWAVDRPEMGVHCSLGGQALAVLAGLDDRWKDVPAVLACLRDQLGGKITRLDLAWDDKTGVLDLDRMETEVRAGNFTSRWKGGYRRWGWGNQAGETLYFGSRSSDAMLRAYDKRQERIAKEDFDAVDGLDHWVRVELQLRRDRAEAAAALFQDVKERPRRVFAELAGVLRGYLEFKTPSPTDSNRRRWEPAGWWLDFLGHVEKARLAVEVIVKTIHDVMGWLADAVAPSLALVDAALGADRARSFLEEQTVNGRARWGPRHRAILAASGA